MSIKSIKSIFTACFAWLRFTSKETLLADRLKQQLTETVTITRARKLPRYAEILPRPDAAQLVRIYDRATSAVLHEELYPSLIAAQQAVLARLSLAPGVKS